MVDDPDLKLIREGFEDDEALWLDTRKARNEDIKALGPESTWDPDDRDARKAAGRPCLAFDELGQYVNQLVNDARETKRAIEVNPGPGDEKTAENDARVVAAIVRQIEARSRAQMAYTQMFDDAASGSYGFLRIVPQYLQQKVTNPSARSFDQELIIKSVHNPDLITPGYFTKPDFSDCSRFWVHESYTHEQFRLAFPEAEITDFSGSMAHARWVDDKRVWVRELWELKTKRKRLALLPPAGGEGEPVGIWAETIPKDKRKDVLKSALNVRDVDEPYVCQTITNGVEILKENKDWKGRHIPIVGCVGRTLWVDGKRQILSLIRNARGPQQLFNYYKTSEAEEVGMTPKVPSFSYKGALDPTNKANLLVANQVPVGVIEVDGYPEGWNPAHGPVPFPQRTPYAPNIQAFEVGAESTRRSIQSATGTGFLPTEAQRQNQKSGVALREIASSATKGAYHFVDNFEHAMMRTAEIIVDLLPHYYDTARDIHVRGKDDKPIRVRINDPQAQSPQEFGGQPIMLKPEQEFDVALSTGPSYATERDKASEFADQLVTVRPEIFAAIGGDIVRLKNLGPIGDKLAEVLDVLAPPPVQQMRSGQQPLPPQAQQAMAQLQQAQQMIQQLQQMIQTDQVKMQGQIELAKIKGRIELALTELKGKQAREKQASEVAAAIDTREDEQQHELAMAGADAAASEATAQRAAERAYLTGGPSVSQKV